MWRTFSTAHGGCFPLHGGPGPGLPAGHHGDAGEEPPPRRPDLTRIVAPDLIGMSPQDARRTARFAEVGLVLEERPVEGGLRNRVFRQTPEPGAQVRPGDVVEAWVGARPGVVVPDMHGTEEQEALASLRSVGLYPSRRVVRRSNSVANGLVIRTRPRAGTVVPTGSRITYVVAAVPRARASAKRDARHSRVRWTPAGGFMSLPEQE